MLAPVEEGENDTLWHTIELHHLYDVDEEQSSIAVCTVTSAKALYAAFMAIPAVGGWDEEKARSLHGWDPASVESPTPGTPDDAKADQTTYIALLTKDSRGCVQTAEGCRNWVILRAPRGRTAAQSFLAEHKSLLGIDVSESDIRAITFMGVKSEEKFDLDQYYQSCQVIRDAKAQRLKEEAERRQLRELHKKYPDEIDE